MTNPFTNGSAGSAGPAGSGGPAGTGSSPFGQNPFSQSPAAPGTAGTPGTADASGAAAATPAASPAASTPFGTPQGTPFGAAPAAPFGSPSAAPSGTGPAAPAAPGVARATPATTTVSTTPTKGPSGILWGATAAAVVGLVLGVAAFFSGSATDGIYHVLAVLGWIFAGIVTFIVLGLYTGQDTKRRAESFYVTDDRQTLRYRITAGVAVVGVLVTAVEIALWLSKTLGA